MVVLQHPVTTEYGDGLAQINATIEAVDRVGRRGMQVVWLWPNADAGSDDVAKGSEIVHQRNGAIYLVTTSYFRSKGRLRSDSPVIYEMPWERSINIDTPGDLMIAKALIESGMIGP